jgi:hypothetical protein
MVDLRVSLVNALLPLVNDSCWAGKSASRTTGMGRLHAVAIGCFREAQPQGLLLGDELGKPAGMSRPTADIPL